jgi:proline iminopeptidase
MDSVDNSLGRRARFVRRTVLSTLGVFLSLPFTQAGPTTKAEDRLAPGEHYAALADVRLHYTVAGDGPLLIVCSPGLGQGSLYLQRGLAPLEKKYKLLFLDTRGGGKSSRPADPRKMSGADMADDIEHLRAYLGVDKIRLLGHSDSASIALDYAERYSANTSHLIFVDGILLGDGDTYRKERARRAALLSAFLKNPEFQTTKEALNTPPPNTDEALLEWMKRITPAYLAHIKAAQALWKDSEGSMPSAWQCAEHNRANQAYAWHQEEQLGKVQASALIIVGMQDRICPTLIGQHVHEGIHGSQLVEIDQCGHFPWLEQPTEFFQSVDRFLQDR